MPNDPNPILRAENISKRYPGVQALNKVDFELYPGEVRALLGKNGAGKSTLVKILSGATLPDNGQIFIGESNQLLELRSPSDAFQAGIATVYQEMSLVKGLTVAENILLGRWPRSRFMGKWSIDQKEMFEKAKAALDLMDVNIDLNEIVGRLSVSEQQVIEIAKALSFRPKVLILDEPTSSLPQNEVDILLRLVRRMAENGVSVIYVSHRLQEIPRVADNLTVLRDGNIVGTISAKEATPARIASLMIGDSWARSDERLDNHCCEAVRLSVRHLKNKHLHDISFELHAGEVLGIAGLLGSGRTELLRAIFGLDPLESGAILIDEEEIRHPNPALMKGKGLGLTPEDRKAQGLVLALGVDDNLVMSSMDRISSNQIVSFSKIKELALRMMNVLDIQTPSLRTPAISLSGGNQQKLVIGKWLNSEVKILLMDEPTRGIDIQTKGQVYKLVRELAKDGISVIFVSSELEEVLQVADTILVMNQGHISVHLSSEEADLEKILTLAMQVKKEEVIQ